MPALDEAPDRVQLGRDVPPAVDERDQIPVAHRRPLRPGRDGFAREVSIHGEDVSRPHPACAHPAEFTSWLDELTEFSMDRMAR